jgi:hypothetical protein
MSFYMCLGKWSGLGIEINYITGIRVILGWLVFGIVPYHMENMMTSAISMGGKVMQEVMLLSALIKEKLPEDYEKLYPAVDPK